MDHYCTVRDSNGQISILIPIEMLRSAYIERGLHPKNLARTVEDSATIFEPILPWTAAGAYMAGTLGVATLSYLPWAILCWSGIFFATLWGSQALVSLDCPKKSSNSS